MANKNREPDAGFRIREELRRGSRAQPHDPRPKKSKTRAGRKKIALADWN